MLSETPIFVDQNVIVKHMKNHVLHIIISTRL